MAHHGYAVGVDVSVGFQVIESAAQAPRPSGYGSPLTGRGFGLAGLIEERVDAVLKTVVVVRIQVAVVDAVNLITELKAKKS